MQQIEFKKILIHYFSNEKANDVKECEISSIPQNNHTLKKANDG